MKVLSSHVHYQWSMYQKMCIEVAAVDAKIPTNASDPFHYNRILSLLYHGIEDVIELEKDVRLRFKALRENEKAIVRERVLQFLGYLPVNIKSG